MQEYRSKIQRFNLLRKLQVSLTNVFIFLLFKPQTNFNEISFLDLKKPSWYHEEETQTLMKKEEFD